MRWSSAHDDDEPGTIDISGKSGESIAVRLLDGVGAPVLTLGTVKLPGSGQREVAVPVAAYCPGDYRVEAQSTSSAARRAEGTVRVYTTGSDATDCTALSPYAPGNAPSLGLGIDDDARVVYPYADKFLDTTTFYRAVSGIHGISDADAVVAELHVRVGSVTRTMPVAGTGARFTPSGLPFGKATAWMTTLAADGTTLRSNTVSFEIRRTALRHLAVQAADVEAHPWTDTRNRTDIVVYDAAMDDLTDLHQNTGSMWTLNDVLRLTGQIKVYGPGSTTPIKTFRFRNERTCRLGFTEGGHCNHGIYHRLQFVPAKQGAYVAGEYRVTVTFRAQQGGVQHASTTFKVHAGRVVDTRRVH